MIHSALIWGASGGIGRAIVELLAREGWQSLAVVRHPEGLQSLTPHVFQADVVRPHEVSEAVRLAAQETESVSLWVYAAGDILQRKAAETTPSDWQRIIDANLTGAFLTYQASLPLLAADAHLVFIGAISERLRLPGFGAYVAAKAGLEAFAEALSKEERKRRVTVVRAGAVATPLWDKVTLRMPAHHLTPAQVAEKIWQAHISGHQGNLDL